MVSMSFSMPRPREGSCRHNEGYVPLEDATLLPFVLHPSLYPFRRKVPPPGCGYRPAFDPILSGSREGSPFAPDVLPDVRTGRRCSPPFLLQFFFA